MISLDYFVNILVISPQKTQYCDFRLKSDYRSLNVDFEIKQVSITSMKNDNTFKNIIFPKCFISNIQTHKANRE